MNRSESWELGVGAYSLSRVSLLGHDTQTCTHIQQNSKSTSQEQAVGDCPQTQQQHRRCQLGTLTDQGRMLLDDTESRFGNPPVSADEPTKAIRGRFWLVSIQSAVLSLCQVVARVIAACWHEGGIWRHGLVHSPPHSSINPPPFVCGKVGVQDRKDTKNDPEKRTVFYLSDNIKTAAHEKRTAADGSVVFRVCGRAL